MVIEKVIRPGLGETRSWEVMVAGGRCFGGGGGVGRRVREVGEFTLAGPRFLTSLRKMPKMWARVCYLRPKQSCRLKGKICFDFAGLILHLNGPLPLPVHLYVATSNFDHASPNYGSFLIRFFWPLPRSSISHDGQVASSLCISHFYAQRLRPRQCDPRSATCHVACASRSCLRAPWISACGYAQPPSPKIRLPCPPPLSSPIWSQRQARSRLSIVVTPKYDWIHLSPRWLRRKWALARCTPRSTPLEALLYSCAYFLSFRRLGLALHPLDLSLRESWHRDPVELILLFVCDREQS
ncbi:hypothetical protein FN846DRAFT_343357 [Sphaerosporella brunnea]|uniref:Uncharacterized protein n=1 Tax=Sphaerosporella brunnea TaxID=1250544 RepID=A0A5J5EJT5_9PEZI|nr:hypothetical protein FN846DRAFT_343357 [Sphaerosporella brunnea]